MIGDEELAKRRQKVNDDFCKTIIAGGQQCWVSKVCEHHLDYPAGDSTVVARLPNGAPKAVAHVEGERGLSVNINGATVEELRSVFGERVIMIGSQVINLSATGSDAEALNNDLKVIANMAIRFYKITYSFTNPDDKGRNLNVVFSGTDSGEQPITANFYDPELSVDPEATQTRIGSNPISFFSVNKYDNVCVVWSPSISRFAGGSASQVCNTLSEYEGAATPPSSVPITDQAKASQDARKKPVEGGRV